MSQRDILADRFDAALFSTMQHLGPQLVRDIPLDLTPGQVFMLHFISEQQNCTASILSEKMEVNPSAVTVMLDRLEQHEFVVRKRSSKDRRMIVLELTETGEKALHQVLDIRRNVLTHCFDQLSPEEPERLVESLERLSEAAAALDATRLISAAIAASKQSDRENRGY